MVEADYFINKSYIAKVLCINKEKPKLRCNGKCYLTKQLKEQQKQDQQIPVAKKSKIEVQWFSLLEPIKINIDNQDSSNNYGVTVFLQLSSYPHSVFRPPII